MEFIAATNNPGKMAEMRRILERMGHTVRSQREAGVTLEPEENGTTFAENARIKARAICEAASTATIADDSGLCVDATRQACIRLFTAATATTNQQRQLLELAGVPEGKRAARFVAQHLQCLPAGAAVFARRVPHRPRGLAMCAEGRSGFD